MLCIYILRTYVDACLLYTCMKVPPTAQLDVLAGVAATEAVSSNEYKVCDII